MTQPRSPRSLDDLRRAARTLKKADQAGDAQARQRVAAWVPDLAKRPLRHADYLHVIAREENHPSWPQLKLAVETLGMDRAAKVQRLKIALFHGQGHVVEHLLATDPDLAKGHLGLEIALFDRAAVAQALAADPTLATRQIGPRTPILHLAFSRMLQHWPERKADMLAIARLLVSAGAKVNDSAPESPGSESRLSALYWAIGHARNMPLARFLLANGADPNDGESLYHSTEIGHHEGLRMLLDAGADPKGTNALLRAMDFDDVTAVELLLAAGADPNEFNPAGVDGEAPWVIPALHQAARRGCSARMCQTLLDAGADPSRRHRDATPYGFARVYGNAALARLIEAAGGDTALTPDEALLAEAAKGRVPERRYIDPARLNPVYRDILREILHLPDRMPQLRALVAIGVEYDRPDGIGLTPVQIAGWEGLPEVMSWLIDLRPDLGHVNGYGGTLLTTIIHGSDNAPDRATRDHVRCARLALEHGVALPHRAIGLAGDPAMADFLADWAERYPGQVVEGGNA